jgi:hypothetical protein
MERRTERIVKDMYSELDYLSKRIDRLLEDLNNTFSIVDSIEVKDVLNYIYKQLEFIKDRIDSYCVEDCSICPKDCYIECSRDCYDCVRFWKCITSKKVARLVFDE